MSNSVLSEYADYEDPFALAKDTSLSKSERIRILEIWYEDEEQLGVASGEGMIGGIDNKLKYVQRALDSLK